MKKIIALLMVISCCVQAFSQDSIRNNKKIRYFFSVNSGFLAGKEGEFATFSANTVQGITIGKRVRVGGGFGIDCYQDWQALPLFGYVSFDLFKLNENAAFFVSTHYGWGTAGSLPGKSSPSYKVNGGTTFGATIGYRVAIEKVSLYLCAGYKFQSVTSRYEYPPDVYSFAPYFSQISQTNLERFTLTMGVGLH